ncbi:MAG: polysaccharide biosynthesis tyrosine autokinase, partial [Clostridia bacterium]|nr:polysaccharide biosynthesis tyrosine autokinase [Clostridia bacterium]
MKEFKLSNINLYTLASDFLRNAVVYVLAFLIGVMGVKVYSDAIYVPEYTSSMTVSVSTETQYSHFYADLVNTIEVAEVLKNVFDSEVLKIKVEEETGKPFTAKITSSTIAETNLITISVTDSSPQKAYDTLVAVYKNYDKVFNNSVFENTRTNIMSAPTVPVKPSNAKLDSGFGKKLGLVLAALMMALVLFLSFIRDTVKQASDVENFIDGELLAVVYHDSIKKKRRINTSSRTDKLIVSNPNISYGFVESIKRLAIKVLYKLKGKQAKRVMFTSYDQHEGKSTISSSVAIQLAKEGANVLLIDADLRKPTVPSLFPEMTFEKEKSLYAFLKGEAQADEIIQRNTIDGIDVASSPSGHMQSAEVLHKGRLKELLDYAQDKYDVIVLDTPPVSMVADTEQIADIVDLSVLVVIQDRITIPEINETIDMLEAANSEFYG